jgi:hypothetical protein
MRARKAAQDTRGDLHRPSPHNTVTFMKYVVLFPAFILAGCTSQSFQEFFQTPAVTAETAAAATPPVIETLDPTPPPPPPREARTVAQFDTTTAEDRAEAVAAPEPATETRLGTTIATLGSPADPGIWLKTGLVTELLAGRVDYNGKSVNLELRPSGGEAGSGSQISLPAMRLLGAPLTGLLELTVYKD